MNEEKGLGTPSAQPQPQTKKHQKNKVFKTTVLVTAILIVLVIVIGFLTPVFHIREITVTGTKNLSAEKVLDASGLSVGTNIFTFQTVDTEKKIAALPFVKSANVTRVFPNKVSIGITECKPVAEIVCGEALFLTVDETGKILDSTGDTEKYNVPIIEGITVEQFEVGKIVDTANQDELDTAIAISQEISQNKMIDPLEKLAVTEGNFFVHFENNITADIGSGSRSSYKIKFLKEVLANIPEEKSGTIEFIDEDKAVFREYE